MNTNPVFPDLPPLRKRLSATQVPDQIEPPEGKAAQDALAPSPVPPLFQQVPASHVVSLAVPTTKHYTKLHADALTLKQLKVLQGALRSSGDPGANALANDIAKLGVSPYDKLPSLLTQSRSDGKRVNMVLSSTQANGSSGKFRMALVEPGQWVADKEYRLGERFGLDLEKRRSRIDRVAATRALGPSQVHRLRLNAEEMSWHRIHGNVLSARDLTCLHFDPSYLAQLVTENKIDVHLAYRLSVDRVYLRQLAACGQITEEERRWLTPKTGYTNVSAIAEEIGFLEQVNSVVKPQGSATLQGRMHLFAPLMLSDARELSRSENNPYGRSRLARLLLAHVSAELCRAHNKGFVHGDIKLENIFFRKDGTFHMGDYGLAAKFSADGLQGYRGTETTAAPEVIQQLSYDTRAEVFSLGVTALEMALGQDFLAHRADRQALRDLEYGKRLDPDAPTRETGLIRYTARGEVDQAWLLSLDAHQAQVRRALHDWHVIDPQAAAFAFNHMLRHDPTERKFMPQVHAFFKDIPQQSANYAKDLADQIDQTPEAKAQRSIMGAFLQAYLAPR